MKGVFEIVIWRTVFIDFMSLSYFCFIKKNFLLHLQTMEDAVHFSVRKLLFKQSLDCNERCVWFCYKLALNLILRFPVITQQSFLFIFWGWGVVVFITVAWDLYYLKCSLFLIICQLNLTKHDFSVTIAFGISINFCYLEFLINAIVCLCFLSHCYTCIHMLTTCPVRTHTQYG